VGVGRGADLRFRKHCGGAFVFCAFGAPFPAGFAVSCRGSVVCALSQVPILAAQHIYLFKLRFWLGRAYPGPPPGQHKQLCKRKDGLIRPTYGRGPASQEALKWAHICALEVPCSALFVLVGM
jgi:hypothetical protein